MVSSASTKGLNEQHSRVVAAAVVSAAVFVDEDSSNLEKNPDFQTSETLDEKMRTSFMI